MIVAVIWELVVATLVVVACAALFVGGFLRPHRSHRSERAVRGALAHAEKQTRHRSETLGDLLAKPLRTSRRAAKKSAEAGREARDEAPF